MFTLNLPVVSVPTLDTLDRPVSPDRDASAVYSASGASTGERLPFEVAVGRIQERERYGTVGQLGTEWRLAGPITGVAFQANSVCPSPSL